jgi:predicted transcriptional regulator
MYSKATFTLDEETVMALRRAAGSTGKSQSLIVREAIAQYDARADRLSQAEQRHLLGVLAEIRRHGPTTSPAAVTSEIAAIRRARRSGGRRSGR